jgi:hypothetical protein
MLDLMVTTGRCVLTCSISLVETEVFVNNSGFPNGGC